MRAQERLIEASKVAAKYLAKAIADGALAHTVVSADKALTRLNDAIDAAESGCTCDPVGPAQHDSDCALVTSGVGSSLADHPWTPQDSWKFGRPPEGRLDHDWQEGKG